MSEIDTMLADSATRFFSDLCTREVMDAVERGEWLANAWQQTCDIGLAGAASMPLDDDTAGLSLGSLCRLALLAGQFSVPLPLVETFIAQRALMRAGIAFDESQPIALSTLVHSAAITLHPSGQGDYILEGFVKHVAWGRHCPRVLVSAVIDGQPCIALVERPASVISGTNLAGEPRDTLVFSGHTVAPDRIARQHDLEGLTQIVWEGALLRAQQIAGAMHRVLNMTIAYALEREQFGRPIAKFQAIQQQIAEQAGQTASTAAVAEAAAHASTDAPAATPIAMAKIRASESASQACAIAHQVHGAMGFTHEHMLHLSSRRMLSWRDEFGSDGHWADWLGRKLQTLGSTPLWHFITDTPQPALTPVAEESAA